VKACGSILTNYCWTEPNVEASIHLALREKVPSKQVFFGIDVWAQNTTKLTHPRTTYPEYGGGGTNTGIAVAKLAETGLSAGVFAPAWSFEHFPGHGRAIERAMWEGTDLPEGLECSCGNCTVRHRSNKDFCIKKFAKAFVAGSETFFFTDFRRAFGAHGLHEKETLFNGFDIHAQLGSQSPLPIATCPAQLKSSIVSLSHRLEEAAGQPYLAIDAQASQVTLPVPNHTCLLPLFNLDMPADSTRRLHISYTNTTPATHPSPSIYLRINNTTHLFPTHPGPGAQTLTTLITTADSTPQRLHELGVHVESSSSLQESTPLLHIHSICITPTLSLASTSPPPSISNLTLTSHTHPRPHTRLHWTQTSSGVPGLPCSATTGAFSAFEVKIDGLKVGRVGANECVVPETLMERGEGVKAEVDVEIEGWGFDGAVLAVGRTRAGLESLESGCE
jgi:hypothetical protein